jgi:hypothetical protein
MVAGRNEEIAWEVMSQFGTSLKPMSGLPKFLS